MRLIVIVAISLLGFGGQAMAAPHRCAKAATVKMAQLGVAASQIKRIVFADIVEDDRTARLYQSSQLLTLMAGFHELAGVILLTT